MNHNPFGMHGFDGINIAINPHCDDVPRMTVSRKFAELMPAEFVSDLNAWMLEFFGRHDVSYSIDNGRTLVVGPKTMRKLREVMA